MSIAVGLEALRERVGEYGPTAFLVTVGEDSRPHVVGVSTRWDGDAADTLVVGAGTRTAANARARSGVTLLWAASPPGSGYCLIVDGTAAVRSGGAGGDSGDGGDELAVQPSRAVLHRLPDATADGPSCVPVLG